MKTDDYIRVINNSYFTNLTTFINMAHKMFPDIRSIHVSSKQDMGLVGILASCIIETNDGAVIVRGFLYYSPSWSEETHGYVTAVKI